MEGGVLYAHGHLMIATAVGLLTVPLAIWLWRAEQRRWMKWLGLAAVGAVVLQGALGGLTVLYKLPKPVSIGHACLAQLFFSGTMVIARFTSPASKQAGEVVEDAGRPYTRSLALAAPLVVLGQLALGAAARHNALGVMPHVLGAFAVTAVVVLAGVSMVVQYGHHRVLRPTAWHLMGITVVEVLLGIATYMSRISSVDAGPPTSVMIVFTVAHVAVGALTMAAAVTFAIQALSSVRRT